MGNESKISKYVDEPELAAFFRDLAEALEKKGEGVGDELACLGDFKKLKIGVKNEFGQIKLKMKVKPASPCEEVVLNEDGEEVVGIPAKPKYKTLKKRMKSSFRMIFKMIHEGQVPPRDAVDSFLEDSALMVTYPGYGDEYYDEYMKVCEAFKKAYETADMIEMGKTVDALAHEKSRCHAKYD